MTLVTVKKLTMRIFSHPDYTVGFGIPPNRPFGSRTVTAGEELHLALKNTVSFIRGNVGRLCVLCFPVPSIL